VIAVIAYVVQLIGAIKLPPLPSSSNHDQGPVIRIHYV